MSGLTQDKLKSLLDYNPITGEFTWKKHLYPKRIGEKATHKTARGYNGVNIEGNFYKCHRLAWLYMEGYLPEHDIDHINRKKSDDRWLNLRHISHQCNIRNTGNFSNNTSGVKGVFFYKRTKRWSAQITIKNKNYNIGRYIDFDDAVCARLAAEQCLGWSGCDSESPAFKYVQKNILRKRT